MTSWRCPICHVQTIKGTTCRYHKRNEARVAAAVLELRERQAIVAILCEAIDEARTPEPAPRRSYHRDYYHANLEKRRRQARESKRRRRLSAARLLTLSQ